MKTVRLTAAQAIVRYLVAQRTVLDGEEAPLVPGVFAIFGHGNARPGQRAHERRGEQLPTYRGQNEQGMALAAVGFAKATRRRQLMAATSIGPGALNMVTAAGVAHANRLPVLLLAGDTFQSRIPDPVLQQVEHVDSPSTTVNDAFRPVTRYWDRITRPEQVVQSLSLALETMLDPADCGPAFIGLPQDVQAEAYDYPEALFRPRVHELRRQRPDRRALDAAVAALRRSQRPLLVAGGGVHYSIAEDELARFAEAHGIPVVETVAGKSSPLADHPCLKSGRSASPAHDHANRLAPRPTSSSPSARGYRISPARSDRVRRGHVIALNAACSTRRAPRPPLRLRRAGRLAELERELAGWGADEADRARAGRGGRFQGVRRRDDVPG